MSNQSWKYVGPHDAVDIPGVGTVKQGEVFTPASALEDLADRPDFEPAETPAGEQPPAGDQAAELKKLTVPQLREIATVAGIETDGLKKPALIAAITEKES